MMLLILMIPLALCDAAMLLMWGGMIFGKGKGHDGSDRDL